MSARPGSALAATAGSVLVGMLVAFQARANGELADRLGGGFSGGAQAALVNFLTGLALVTGWVLALSSQRRAVRAIPARLGRGGLGWWNSLAGLGGAFLILSQAASVPRLGVAVFTVAVVAGQTGGSLAVDQVGLGPAGRQPVTVRRAVAAVVAVGAVVLAVSGRLGSAGFSPVLALVCVAAGVAVSGQSALNGRVGQAVGSPVAAAWLNFVVGASALGVTVAGLAAAGHRLGTLPATWWLYTGGPAGLAFVAVVAAAVRAVGVLLVALATVAGQVVGAVALDAVAPASGQSLQASTLVGAVLTVLAVLVAMDLRAKGRPVQPH